MCASCDRQKVPNMYQVLALEDLCRQTNQARRPRDHGNIPRIEKSGQSHRSETAHTNVYQLALGLMNLNLLS